MAIGKKKTVSQLYQESMDENKSLRGELIDQVNKKNIVKHELEQRKEQIENQAISIKTYQREADDAVRNANKQREEKLDLNRKYNLATNRLYNEMNIVTEHKEAIKELLDKLAGKQEFLNYWRTEAKQLNAQSNSDVAMAKELKALYHKCKEDLASSNRFNTMLTECNKRQVETVRKYRAEAEEAIKGSVSKTSFIFLERCNTSQVKIIKDLESEARELEAELTQTKCELRMYTEQNTEREELLTAKVSESAFYKSQHNTKHYEVKDLKTQLYNARKLQLEAEEQAESMQKANGVIARKLHAVVCELKTAKMPADRTEEQLIGCQQRITELMKQRNSARADVIVLSTQVLAKDHRISFMKKQLFSCAYGGRGELPTHLPFSTNPERIIEISECVDFWQIKYKK